jgi:ribosomal protein S18 acetylase RimI-like enzyme
MSLYFLMGSMNIKIREFQVSDQAVVKELVLQGLGEHFGRINPDLNPDLNDINHTYVAAGHYFVVAEIDDLIIGGAALIKEKPHTGRIVRVTVSPRQRRAGIGRKLIEHLLQTAVEKQYRQILVETNHDWYDAIRLYERCGFREFDRDEESIYLSLTL